MGLQADLSDFTLSEIIYFLSHFKKTGVLTVKAGNSFGEVYFDKGDTVHAILGDIKGPEAVFNLCLETLGEAKYTAGAKSPEVTIKEGAGKILEEGERRRTEMAEILKSLPPLDTVLTRTAQAPEESAITIRRSDWTIMALVNGKRDIRQIVTDSKLGMFEVVKTVAWLLAKNLVMDPKEMDRLFRDKINFVNLLLDEFGVKGTGVSPYLELLKSALTELDKGGRMSRHLEFGADKLNIVPGPLSDVTKEEMIEIWERLSDAVHKKGMKEFGPMLGKHKYQTAQARSLK
jgi:hypothetical protein